MSQLDIISVSVIDNKPIKLEEAKQYLRVVGGYDDALIYSLIDAGLSFTETFLRQSIIKKEIIGRLNAENIKKFKLTGSPLSSIEYIKKIEKEEEKILDRKDYDISGKEVLLKKSFSGEIEIKYNIGFIEIPSSIRQAILIYISMLYDKEIINNQSLESVFTLLGPYKNIRII